jgi:drug/metabolite transporter (DMT)-like permease
MPDPSSAGAEAGALPRGELGGLARIALAAAVWGTIPLLLHASDGAPLIKVFYRVLFAGIVVGGWMVATGRIAEVFALPRRKLLQLAGQGTILCVNWLLFLTALDMTNVATAELLAYTGPVFVAALAPFVSKERPDRRIVVPLLLALGGIGVILAPQGLAVASGRELLGAVLAFLSALTFATLLLRSKKILAGVTSGALMLVEYATASVLLLPAVVWLYATGQGPTGAVSYAALATLGIVQTALAGFVFLSGLRRVRTDHAAILTYGEPVFAVLFAALFLREPLTAWTLVGGFMVVAGGALVARLDAGFGPDAPIADSSIAGTSIAASAEPGPAGDRVG